MSILLFHQFLYSYYPYATNTLPSNSPYSLYNTAIDSNTKAIMFSVANKIKLAQFKEKQVQSFETKALDPINHCLMALDLSKTKKDAQTACHRRIILTSSNFVESEGVTAPLNEN
uniref:Uncharacterized protein n=1 Tax=Glossina austeni TaxID=7395 RepID=A0A1A9VDJ3_GLOAU